jgi:hypothetical protein
MRAALLVGLLVACTGDITVEDIGGACDGTSCMDEGPDAGVPDPQPLPVPTCSNVDQRLHDDFGIVIKPGTIAFEGLPSEDISCGKRIKVYQMFMRAFQYERFPVRLMVSDPFTMHLYRSY